MIYPFFMPWGHHPRMGTHSDALQLLKCAGSFLQLASRC